VAGNYSDDVEQKNEQIIGVSHCCRKRLVMDNFKVNQPRSASPLVVKTFVMPASPCDHGPGPHCQLLPIKAAI
jgi:hypothetical protein